MTDSQMHRLLRIPEVAEILQVSKTTAYRLVQEGGLPAVKIGKSSVRVRMEDLERYIQLNMILNMSVEEECATVEN